MSLTGRKDCCLTGVFLSGSAPPGQSEDRVGSHRQDKRNLPHSMPRPGVCSRPSTIMAQPRGFSIRLRGLTDRTQPLCQGLQPTSPSSATYGLTQVTIRSVKNAAASELSSASGATARQFRGNGARRSAQPLAQMPYLPDIRQDLISATAEVECVTSNAHRGRLPPEPSIRVTVSLRAGPVADRPSTASPCPFKTEPMPVLRSSSTPAPPDGPAPE